MVSGLKNNLSAHVAADIMLEADLGAREVVDEECGVQHKQYYLDQEEGWIEWSL